MRTIKRWLKNARSGALPQSMMPAAVALAMAWGREEFSLFLGVLAVAGVAFAHLGFNLLDDYFDYVSHQTGYRHVLNRAGFRAYTAKCPYLQDGTDTLKGLVAAIACFGGAALACGAVIFLNRGLIILVIGAAAGLLGYFYSGKPLRLSYHGLGEAVIGIEFGLLNMVGVYASACGQTDPAVVIVGIIMGILVMVILFTHSVLDYEADQSVEKKTLAALFPTAASRLAVFYGMNLMPYVLAAAGVCLKYLSGWYLLTWAVLPLSLELCRSVTHYAKDPRGEVRWKRWYGPGKDWNKCREAGVDWFLVRWLLARNIVTFFGCVCIAAVLLSGGAG